MATITLTAVVGGQTYTLSKTLTDANMARVVAWLRTRDSGYGIVRENVIVDGVQMWQERVATAPEAFRNFGASVFGALASGTKSYEQRQAAVTAEATVTDIEAV